MSENNAGSTKDRTMVPLGRVGPADRGADHFEQNIARFRRRRLLHVLYANVMRAVKDGRFHPVSTRSGL